MRTVYFVIPGSSKILTLCEVMVHGTVVTDLARTCGANKDGACPTSQSSTTHGGDAARGDNNAGLNGLWNSGACTHTAAENNPWWRVDMERQVEVTSLKIVGRSDCCSERTQGFAVC